MNSPYFKTYTGKEFNKLYSGTKLYKITNKDEVHHGLPYRTGTNTLKQGEVYHPTRQEVGLYFFRMHDFLNVYTNNLLPSDTHWIREVTIPNDATVTVSGEYCFKTDRFVLEARERFYMDHFLSESQIMSTIFLSSSMEYMLKSIRAPTIRMYAAMAYSSPYSCTYRSMIIPEFILRQRLFWFALIRECSDKKRTMRLYWQYVPALLGSDETFWIECANQFGWKIIKPGCPIFFREAVYDKMYRRRSKRLKRDNVE